MQPVKYARERNGYLTLEAGHLVLALLLSPLLRPSSLLPVRIYGADVYDRIVITDMYRCAQVVDVPGLV